MKCLLLIFVVIAVTAYAVDVPGDPEIGYKKGERYFFFAEDEDETLQLIDTQEPVDIEFIKDSTDDPSNFEYWLFTRSNPDSAEILQYNDESSLTNSNFDFSKVTVFIAHGWKGHAESKVNTELTEAFLQNDDVNVIVFDWRKVANTMYITAKPAVAPVGRCLGKFINWLATLGMSYEKVHLVGFSLGGHLVGNAGRETESQVKRITALDPAGPLWENDPNRLVATDGQYVEVIHTNIVFLGIYEPSGHADFYPNGGANMPGCKQYSCSHSRSYKYMAMSLKDNNLLANKCNSFTEIHQDKCTGELSPMGNSDLNKKRAGLFRVNIEETF